jgi:hypothetical protein
VAGQAIALAAIERDLLAFRGAGLRAGRNNGAADQQGQRQRWDQSGLRRTCVGQGVSRSFVSLIAWMA